jgi:hypothetical protein
MKESGVPRAPEAVGDEVCRIDRRDGGGECPAASVTQGVGRSGSWHRQCPGGTAPGRAGRRTPVDRASRAAVQELSSSISVLPSLL